MKILVTLDGSELSEAVLKEVQDVVTSSQAEVHLLRVGALPPRREIYRGGQMAKPNALDDVKGLSLWANPSVPSRSVATLPTPVETYDQAVERAERIINEYLREKAAALQAPAVSTKAILSDDPAGAIIKFAREGRFDLIAMSTHGHTGLRAIVMGNVAQRVVSSGAAPVLLVRPLK